MAYGYGRLYDRPDFVWVLLYHASGRRKAIYFPNPDGSLPRKLKDQLEWLSRGTRPYELIRFENPYNKNRLFDLEPLPEERLST